MTDNVSFAPQLLPEQFAQVKEKGYASVINNRPDNEAAEQPTHESLAAAAQKAGLAYAYVPVVSGQMTQQNIEDFAQAYNAMKKPVLMFCRSGSRSNVLYQAAKQMDLLDD